MNFQNTNYQNQNYGNLTDTGQGVGNSTTNTSQGVGNSTTNTSQGVGNATTNTSQGVGNSTTNTSQGVGNSTTNTSQGVGNATTNTSQGVGNSTTNTSQGVGNSTTNTGQGVGNSTTNTGQGVGNATTNTGQGVGNATTNTGQGVGNAFMKDMKRSQSFNSSMIVFSSLYVMIWIFVSTLMYKFISFSSCSVYLFILLNLGIGICFLLSIFYSPWNHYLHNKINKSKQKCENIKKDTEPIYQHQIKTFWLNDLNQQTQYYLYSYMLLSFLPFFYYLILLLFNIFIQPNFFTYDDLYLFIVKFSLFYTGLQLLMYCIAAKQWINILIPVILFLFMFAIGHYSLQFKFISTIAIVILSVITSILTLMTSPLYLKTIPLFLCGVIGVILRMSA